MPTHSLIQARTLANLQLDQGIEAKIEQVSQQRFNVLPETHVRKGFRLHKKWVIACFALLLISIGFHRLTHLQPEPSPLSVASQDSEKWLETLNHDQLAELVDRGTLVFQANTFVEVKRIELGGFLTLLANQSVGAETQVVRLDLIRSDIGWNIEKWVRIE
jgi:hypothetical protein